MGDIPVVSIVCDFGNYSVFFFFFLNPQIMRSVNEPELTRVELIPQS